MFVFTCLIQEIKESNKRVIPRSLARHKSQLQCPYYAKRFAANTVVLNDSIIVPLQYMPQFNFFKTR